MAASTPSLHSLWTSCRVTSEPAAPGVDVWKWDIIIRVKPARFDEQAVGVAG